MLFSKKDELPYCLSDCDGTIALPNFSIPEDTIKDIVKYQKKSGYHFGIITGRNYIVNKQIIDELKVQLPVISCNGGLIVDPNSRKVLVEELIDKETCIEIFRSAYKDGLDVVAYTNDAMAGTPESNRIKAWGNYRKSITNKKFLFNIITYKDLNELANAIANEEIKPIELVITAWDDKAQQTMNDLVAKYTETTSFVESQKGQYNVLKKGVSKGSALKKWADIIKVNARDVIVFGDNYNDISMFEITDKHYAVDNGVDKLKDMATKVIDTCENDGVGQELKDIMTNGN